MLFGGLEREYFGEMAQKGEASDELTLLYAMHGVGTKEDKVTPILERFATMYGPTEHGGLELLDAPATSPFREPPRFLSGGIGLVSTATDYLRFAQMLLNGGELEGARLLGRKTVELMTTNHLPDKLIPIRMLPHTLHGCGFGLGFRVVVSAAQAGLLTSEGEYGWGGAAGTSFFIDPKEDLIGLLLTQLMPSRTYPNRNQFKVLVGQALVD